MTNIVGSIVNGGSGSSSFTLTNGATIGRAVVVLATQQRSPVNVAGSDFDFNGIAPSQILAVATGAGSSTVRTLALVWNDSDLPASAGTYTLGSSATLSTRYSIYELSDADTTSVEALPAGNLTAGFTDPVTVNFTTTDINSVLFFVYRQQNNFGSTIGAGDSTDQTVDNATNDYYIAHEIDADGDAQMSIDDGVQNSGEAAYSAIAINSLSAGLQTIRKASQFDIETTLGTITTATLDGVDVFDHVTGQVGTTVSFAGAATDEITTSGEYDLVLGDGVGTETITVQVNVYGVAPSNNPLQKDGAALASLTGVQLRVTTGSNLDGAQLEYLPTATTDASGNLGNIDLSSTAAADTDPVLLHMRTAAGDSIIASETVGLI